MTCQQVKQEALSRATKFLLSGFCLSMQVQVGITYIIFRTSAKWKFGIFFARSRVKSHQVMFLVGFPGGSNGKELACNVGDLSSIPGSGRSLGVGMATHSSILARSIPWNKEPGRLQATGWHRVGQDGATNTFTFNVSSGTIFLKCFNSSYKLTSCI